MSETKIPTEIYSRVSGYFRPVAQWNRGKQEEFSERQKLKFNEDDLNLYPVSEMSEAG